VAEENKYKKGPLVPRKQQRKNTIKHIHQILGVKKIDYVGIPLLGS
jgi:hypothetical protein